MGKQNGGRGDVAGLAVLVAVIVVSVLGHPYGPWGRIVPAEVVMAAMFVPGTFMAGVVVWRRWRRESK